MTVDTVLLRRFYVLVFIELQTREFVEECRDGIRMTWLRIVPGLPGEPTVEIQQTQSDWSDKVVRSLDVKETRELIGWRPEWDT